MKRLAIAIAFAIALTAAAVAAQGHEKTSLTPMERVDFNTSQEELFSESGVKRGVRANEAECRKVEGAVWAVVGSDAECIRYWHAGFTDGKAPKALFYFDSDLLTGNPADFEVPASYLRVSPKSRQASTSAVAARLGVPYVFVGRPGVYGSSGDHRQRRRPLEAKLMSAAIDAIKERHGIQKISVAGMSGGGHVVASLLTMRSDVECAVPASANSAPKMRWTMRGRTQDLTGYSDSFEPVEHLSASLAATGVRVFVLGDPNDTNVPWSTQLPLAKRLKQLGVAVEELEGEGAGPERHALAGSSTLIGSMCMKGATTPEILERAKQGLKG